MEALLQYSWQHRLLTSGRRLSTVDGKPLQVIDPGLLNRDAGPDFFNAKVRIGEQMWVGNVEIHVRASDWYRHKHQNDRAYDSVILHVVHIDDCEVTRPDGSVIPQLHMPCSPDFIARYSSLVESPVSELPCAPMLSEIPSILVHDWLDALAFERLYAKAGRIAGWVERFHGSWEDACYVTTARALGFGINGDAFERTALSLPLRFLRKHSDSPLSVEALLFGQAGLLDSAVDNNNSYLRRLKDEYAFMAHKFGLKQPVPAPVWKMSRMRPANFPHRRIAALAALVCRGFNLAGDILGISSEEDAMQLFSVDLTGYWASHYSFAVGSAERVSGRALSATSVRTMIINVVVPMALAYAQSCDDREGVNRAIEIAQRIPAEKNSIITLYDRVGIRCKDAFATQAVLQLRSAYCQTRKCLYCRFGHRILSKSR